MASTNLNMLKKTGNNAASDECYTPPEAVLPLLPFLDKRKTWYEPTSGKSKQILRCVWSNGVRMMPSFGGDFFDYDGRFDGIVSNPPFSKKDKFLKRCYEQRKPFALLLPVSTLQGERRGKLFKEHGVEVLVLNKRIDFTGGEAPHFGVAWFCKGILPAPLLFV